MRALFSLLVVVSFGCGSEVPTSMQAVPAEKKTGTEIAATDERYDRDNPNPMLFEVDARPYGRSIERWTELLWDYIYAIPFDINPFFDPTGVDCVVDQGGPSGSCRPFQGLRLVRTSFGAARFRTTAPSSSSSPPQTTITPAQTRRSNRPPANRSLSSSSRESPPSSTASHPSL